MLNRILFTLLLGVINYSSFSQGIMVTIEIIEVYHRNPSSRDNFSISVDNKGYYFIGGYDYGAFQTYNSIITNVTNSSHDYDTYYIERSGLTEIPIYFFGYSDRCDGRNAHYFKYNDMCYCTLGARCSNKDDYNYDEGRVSIRFWDFLNNNAVSDWVYTNGRAHGFRFKLTWQPFLPSQIVYDKNQYCGGENAHAEGLYNQTIWNGLSDAVKNNFIFHWYYRVSFDKNTQSYTHITTTSTPFVEWEIDNLSDSSIFKTLAVSVEFNGVLNTEYRYNRVPIEILPNPPNAVLFSIIPPECFNDHNADIVIDSVIGQSNRYFYNLKRGESVLYQSSVASYPSSIVHNSTTILNEFDGLNSDLYILSTSNYHNSILGCSRTDTIYIHNKEPVHAEFFPSNYSGYSVSCNGLSNAYIMVQARGGNELYYGEVDSLHFDFDSTNKLVLGNLSPGIRSFRISDSYNCPSFDTTILFTEPLPLRSFITATDIRCHGNHNGSISFGTFGGVPDYKYFISDDLVIGSSIDTLDSGLYTLHTEDRNGCEIDTIIFIREPAPIVHQVLMVNNPLCFDGIDGNVLFSMSGGVSPYRYILNDLTYHHPYIDSLTAGRYHYTLKDMNDCEVYDSIDIFSPNKMNIHSDIHNETCYGKKDGSILFSVSGGVPDYMIYVDDILVEDAILVNLRKGNYHFKILDKHFCEVQETLIVDGAQESILMNFEDIHSATCSSISDGEVEISVEGGVAPYIMNDTIEFDNNVHLHRLKNGYNTLNVKDSLGCLIVDSVFIPVVLDLSLPFQDTIFVCSNQSFIFLDTLSYDQYWSNHNDLTIANDSVITPNQWYKIYTVENQHHCTQLDSFIVIPLIDYVEASFLLPSVVYQNDTLFLIDINTIAVDSVCITSPLQVFQFSDRSWYIIPTDTGTYHVSFRVYSGFCSDEVIKTIDVKSIYSLRSVLDDPLGYQGFLNWKIYPNPFQLVLHCHGELTSAGNVEMMLWDIRGNLLTAKTISEVSSFELDMETGNLPPGLYMIQISTQNDLVQLKLVKDK